MSSVSTYPDWREPVRRLQISTSADSSRYRYSAARWGVELPPDEPAIVAAARIEEKDQRRYRPKFRTQVTPEQRRELECIAAHVLVDPTLSRFTATAWIQHHRALLSLASLLELQLQAGDVVLAVLDSPYGVPHRGDPGPDVVASIGDDGRVYLHGGRGRYAWPYLLTHATVGVRA